VDSLLVTSEPISDPGYFSSMNCDFCLEETPVHAQNFDGAWFLACALCDLRNED
jgi:hypothetical protein